ncbi:MAG: rhodanese-like domain-containing protein [Fidelibacterota bacterium]
MGKYFLMLPFFLLFFSCGIFLSQKFHQDITIDQAAEIIKNHSFDENFVILDVRTEREFASGHIHQAENINYLSKDFRAKVNRLPKDKTYLVYCRSGIRSQKAMEIMKSLGYKKIYNLKSGINGWVKAQKGLVK